MQYGSNISSYNNIQYHAPADLLPLGMTFKAGLTPGGAGGSANASSHSVNGDVTGEMKQYAVTMAPIDGLTLSASYYDFGEMGNKDGRQKQEGGSYSANYSIGQVSVGYGETKHAPAERMSTSASAKVQHYENDAYSIGFAVNDSISISYTEENSEKVVKTTSATNVVTRPSVEMEITTIDVSYTMGGATLGISNSEHSNDSYTTGDDTTETIVAISLAF